MSEIEDLKKEVQALKDQLNPPPSPPSRPPIDYTEGMSMPANALAAMVDCSRPFMADLRADARKPNPIQASQSPISTTPSQSQPTQRGTGWAPERGFPDRTKEFELMDQIVKNMVGGPNDPVK